MMTHRRVRFALVASFAATALLGACSSSTSPGSASGKQGAQGDAGGETPADSGNQMPGTTDSGTRPVDAFNGDCSSARWASVSDTCWSCLCAACKPTLDKCNGDCTNILKCAFEKHTLVNKGTELSCEVSATATLCLADPKSQAVATPLLNFDTCLIAATTKHAGEFRACDTECKTPYSGDVCTRFPPAAAGG